jgi:hypothetical protein
MMAVSAKIDERDAAKLKAVMAEYAREAPLQAKAVVTIAATATMNSAPRFTPVAPKNRKVVEMTPAEREQFAGGRGKYAVEAFTQRQGRRLIPVFGNRQMANHSKARLIRQRGLAQNSWRILAGKIAKGFSLGNSIASKATAVTRNETPLSLKIQADNMLKYINKLDNGHGIISKALNKGADAMERELVHRNESWVQAKWRRMA